MEQAPITLKLDERFGGTVVVMIDSSGFEQVLGLKDAVCDELARFLAEIEFGETKLVAI